MVSIRCRVRKASACGLSSPDVPLALPTPHRYSTRGTRLHKSFGYPPSSPSEAREVLRRARNHTTGKGEPAVLHYLQDELVEVDVQRKGLREGAKRRWSIWGSPVSALGLSCCGR